MANMLGAAQEGQFSVAMKAEDFIYIERDCNYFKDAIRRIQVIMNEVGRHDQWGLGEKTDGMVSANTLVDRFKKKANMADDRNSVSEILDDHYRIVEDIQATYKIVRDRMMQSDSEFAADFNRLYATLPERPPVQLPLGPVSLPDGTGK
ncbi:hypothetical protein IU470_16830 [Nocardia abscessus]|uniref:Uncharacterized protein n=2 Tax=Nocardia abscessus TaxID=120957 RepID=A0ABS0C8R1_9NOCA|nr:hypothetical protein [Nocardia abscessus]